MTQVEQLIARWRYGDALAILEQELGRDPNHVDALIYLGLIRHRTHKSDQAERAFAKALALSPNNTKALAFQGRLYVNAGRMKAAEANLARLRILCPQGCPDLAMLDEVIRTTTDMNSTAY